LKFSITKIVVTVLILFVGLPIFAQEEKTINVAISRNIEILQFYYFLSGTGSSMDGSDGTIEYEGKQISLIEWNNFSMRVYREYKNFENSVNIKEALDFGKTNWFDNKTRLVIGLDDFPMRK